MGRELELADLVSDVVWGGERAWERCSDEEFKLLKKELRKRYRAGDRLELALRKHFNSAHNFDIVVRDGGRDVRYELDWAKSILKDD